MTGKRMPVSDPPDGIRMIDIDSPLTADEVALILKTTPKHVYQLAKSGQLPSFKLGRYTRFFWKDILESLKKGKENGPPA